MCGNDGLMPHTDQISSMYAISAPPRANYDPLAAMIQNAASPYGHRQKHTAADSSLHSHDLLAGISPQSPGDMYRPRQDPSMMYARDNLAGLENAYAGAAMQTASARGSWNQMKFNAGSN